MKLTHEIMDITPAIAQKWLDESKFDNRNIRKVPLARIVNDINAGLWVFDGSPIRFNQDGDVIDGQHRLTAVIRAGRPIKSLVIRGIADRAKMTIDTGAGRRTSDILHFAGNLNTIPMAVAGRLLVGYNEFGGDLVASDNNTSSRSVSAQRICDELEQNPEIDTSHAYVSTKKNLNKMLGRGAASFLHYIFSQTQNGYLADEFFDRLDDGIGLVEGSPIAALRSALVIGLNYKGGREFLIAKCAVTIKAWNLHVKDRNAKYIRWSKKEPFPMVA